MRVRTVTLFAAGAVLCACEPAQPPMEISALSAGCCGGIGLCVPKGFMSEELSSRLPSSECDEAWECAPFDWVVGVNSMPTSCRTLGDLEGRCLPSCMPELEQQAGRLQQETCEAGYLCVPCFDPLTGEDTEACRIEPDPGPEEPAPVLTPCCGGAGHCAARAVLESFAGDDVQQIGPDDACGTERDVLCVAESWPSAENVGEVPCRTKADLQGCCRSRCSPEASAQADHAQQGSCAAEELCLPCAAAESELDTEAPPGCDDE